MSITKYSLLGILLIAPMLILNSIKVDRFTDVIQQDILYQEAINKAVDDAVTVLIETAEHSSGILTINPEAAVDQFFSTLAINLSKYSDYEKEGLRGFVPCIAFIGVDGMVMYSLEEKSGPNGRILSQCIHEMVPYAVVDGNNNVIGLTLEDYYTVYDLSRNIEFTGTYNDLKAIGVSDFFDNAPEDIEQIRTELIVEMLENHCGYYFNQHENFANVYGIIYDFMLPTIEDSTWSNTVNDISIIAFVQGLPLGHGSQEVFNAFSVGGAGIIDARKVEGYELPSGDLVYHWEDCTNKVGTLQEIFDTRQEAAAAGYYPCSDCN